MTRSTKAGLEGDVRVESYDWPTLFTMVPEWVTFAEISDRAHRVYTVLAAHLRRDATSRATGVITQADLAAVCGLSSNPERIRKPVGELEQLGAVRILEEWDPVRKIPLTRYVVRFNPPPGYGGHLRVQSWQEERQAARTVRIEARRKAEERRNEKKAAGHPVTLKNEGHATRKVEGHESLKNEGRSPYVTPADATASDETDAPSARSAADARRATTGSSARDARKSGCAASGKPALNSSGQKPKTATGGAGGGPARMSAAQAAAVREIEAAFPPELRALLPRYRPRVLKLALLDALEARTPQQIADRVTRRWWTYGYLADASGDGHREGIDSPVGVAVTLLRATACPDPMCEDGVVIDLRVACRACEQRRADRRAAKNQRAKAGSEIPAHREPAAERPQWWECADCGAPGKGDPGEDGVCLTCRRTAQSVMQRISQQWSQQERERWEAESAGWLALLEQAHAEHTKRERAAARRAEAVRERDGRRRADEEEIRRLREDLARQHPELAALSHPTAVGVLTEKSSSAPF